MTPNTGYISPKDGSRTIIEQPEGFYRKKKVQIQQILQNVSNDILNDSCGSQYYVPNLM